MSRLIHRLLASWRAAFRRLERDPRRHNNIKRLTGKFAGYYRYRVGDWRVVYRIVDDAKQVQVLSSAHRRDVYE
jgi:mRNA interferase RelE/StbE